jgi:hypothetical protein
MNCKIGINWNWRLQNVFIDWRITQKKQKLTKVAKLLKSEFYSFQQKRKASFIVGGLSNNNNVTSKTQNTTRNTQNTNYLLKKKNTKKWFILCPKFLSYFIQTPKHLCEEGERRG